MDSNEESEKYRQIMLFIEGLKNNIIDYYTPFVFNRQIIRQTEVTAFVLTVIWIKFSKLWNYGVARSIISRIAEEQENNLALMMRNFNPEVKIDGILPRFIRYLELLESTKNNPEPYSIIEVQLSENLLIGTNQKLDTKGIVKRCLLDIDTFISIGIGNYT